jgi:two-component system response regulator RegA
MSELSLTVLLLEDDDAFRERLAIALRRRGLEVRTASEVDAALLLAREESPEWAIVDLRLPGRWGLDAVKELLELDPATRILILTGYGSISTAVEAMRLGAVHYLTKPASVDEILAALEGHPELPAAKAWEPSSLELVEWEHLQRGLLACEGNLSQAARMLGIHRRSLQRKLARNPPLR